MDTPYTSDVFYHMVGWSILRNDSVAPEDKMERCYERLKQVIEFGFIAGRDDSGEFQRRVGEFRYTVDPDGHLRNGDFTGFLVKGVITCYADIPWGSLGLHTSKYGMFGFGVSARYLAEIGARPVIYIPCTSETIEPGFRGHGLLNNMTSRVLQLFSIVDAYEDENNSEDENGRITVEKEHQWSGLNDILMRDIGAYIKPYDARLDISHPECYYTEREWRYLGNVQIMPQKVPIIVVARGYRERLLQEVPIVREFEVRELGS
ncbi:abortive infection system antitoxin AbiGi family protein [Pseudomonas citronellolis]|uniref:abortive infection system antitoxin AbiGi family protein n=1 Tax=Pseudomonas citronellolis TaxID=53408 RepID=UPI0022BA178E|nr:abortive infection system antitoxin AbiGi family protein [Pseudomonas citronellolis]WBG62200.1 hypothetical protein ELR50_04595 [Pseudomonas citronellolis]